MFDFRRSFCLILILAALGVGDRLVFAADAGEKSGSASGTPGREVSARIVSSEGRAALNRLTRIQHWSAEDYTRVVLYTSNPATFNETVVPPDAKRRESGKIHIDLKDCALGPKVAREIRVMDGFLQRVRTARKDHSQSRVTLDLGAIDKYRIFALSDPFRLIVDVRGGRQKSGAPAAAVAPKPARDVTMPSLARQLALDVRRIVIDPGHGGKDKGAISPNNTFEKDVTLAIAGELKRILEERTPYEVILTRTRDRFLSLEERTAIANTQKADLFISIHTNAHEDRNLHGVETYFLNLSTDQESARVAALENAVSSKKLSDLEAILHDLMLNTKINESSQLAAEVQRSIVRALTQANYEAVRDLGTKQAPFYVLMGAEMPSILIESAFITNPREESRLKDRRFQENLARAVASGIESYIQHMRNFVRTGDRS